MRKSYTCPYLQFCYFILSRKNYAKIKAIILNCTTVEYIAYLIGENYEKNYHCHIILFRI